MRILFKGKLTIFLTIAVALGFVTSGYAVELKSNRDPIGEDLPLHLRAQSKAGSVALSAAARSAALFDSLRKNFA
jgi:hypothetical protein